MMAHSSNPPGPVSGGGAPAEGRDPAPSGADPGKRRRILDASIRTFGRRGFHDARIAEIAAAAKVAEGTVYLYFRNKEDLLGTIFDETMDDLLARGRKLAAADAPAADRLTGLVDLHLRILGSDRDLASLFQIELRRSARLMERVIREKLVDYFRILGGVVKEGIASGEFRVDLEPRLAVRVLFGAADEILSEWIFSGGSEPVANAKKLVGALLRGFASGETPSPKKSARTPSRRSPRA
jgi:TetR/AcrR family transcriptional regulator, fatty acid metabolism regulator protein